MGIKFQVNTNHKKENVQQEQKQKLMNTVLAMTVNV